MIIDPGIATPVIEYIRQHHLKLIAILNTSLYPQWLPGNHAPRGPINLFAGLEVRANGERLAWRRDPVNVYAFHVDPPAGARELELTFQFLSPTQTSQGRVVMTPAMLNLQWNAMLLYPAGHYATQVRFRPSVTLPAIWTFATALDGAQTEGQTTRFAETDLETLVDSPMFAGHYARVEQLDRSGRSRVTLNIFAERPDQLAATDPQIRLHRNLIVQADRLFGARHFDHYDLLFALGDRLSCIGLEHHRSSENKVSGGYFTEWDNSGDDHDLNMQRQAVPLIKPHSPVVGTGLEGKVAVDSRMLINAEGEGVVEYVDASEIVIKYDRTDDEKLVSFDDNFKTYKLTKFIRTNQGTCINLKPIIKKGQRVGKGTILCDGYATENGELALGQNLKVAFMPWKGYNFEDAIVISERVVQEDIFTSIHIEHFELDVRDTKLGEEELTNDIPNVSEEATKDLDENGIIRIGAWISEGDILIGKITPKGESDPTPEEKLLRAIFGDKAGDVKDASLKAPPSTEGIIIDKSLYIRLNDSSLCYSANGGATWTPADVGLGIPNGNYVHRLRVAPLGPNEDLLFAATQWGLVLSLNHGQVWYPLSNKHFVELLVPPDVATTQTFFGLEVYNGPFQKTTDFGETWTPQLTGHQIRDIEFSPYYQTGQAIIAHSNNKLWVSYNRGVNWQQKSGLLAEADFYGIYQDTRCQRVGRYVDMPTWEIGYDQLVNQTPLLSAYVDPHADWADEGDTYLPTLRSTAWVMDPVLVDDLMGELCQQGQFYFWWDEYAQSVRMQAVRPPRGTVTALQSAGNIVAKSAELTREPESLITRVFVYYAQVDPLKSATDPSNTALSAGGSRVMSSIQMPQGAPSLFRSLLAGSTPRRTRCRSFSGSCRAMRWCRAS